MKQRIYPIKSSAMQYKVSYEGDLRTEATHLASGSQILTDAPIDNQGQGRYFSPTDLASVSLASCMMTILGITVREHAIAVESMEATVTKTMASNPRRIGGIKIHLRIHAVDLEERKKLILEKAARTCPVALSLHPEIHQDISFEYV
jgi:uncharacterized OsmC-like protein